MEHPQVNKRFSNLAVERNKNYKNIESYILIIEFSPGAFKVQINQIWATSKFELKNFVKKTKL